MLHLTLGQATNDYERMVVDNVKQYGWHCTSVGADDNSFNFAYTIGLYASYRHPELLVIGLPPGVAHGLFTIAADAVTEKNPIDLSKPCDRLLQDYPTLFIKVPQTHYREIVRSACWYYSGTNFPLYQIVWPSKQGLFPWHPNAAREFALSQPVLGLSTPAN